MGRRASYSSTRRKKHLSTFADALGCSKNIATSYILFVDDMENRYWRDRFPHVKLDHLYLIIPQEVVIEMTKGSLRTTVIDIFVQGSLKIRFNLGKSEI